MFSTFPVILIVAVVALNIPTFPYVPIPLVTLPTTLIIEF